MPVQMSPAGGNGGPPAPPFDRSTRFTIIRTADILRPAGGGLSPVFQLPTYGLIAGILLSIRGSTGGGAVTAPNALGAAAIVKRITLTLNNGTVVWSTSGVGYHYLLRDQLDAGYVDVVGQSNARAALAASTAYILDMYIPLTENLRDSIGLILLQNKQTTLSLQVEWEADGNLSTGGTAVYTGFYARPGLLMFSAPPDPRSMPPLRYVRAVLEDSFAVVAAGEIDYNVPRGNTYARIIHGCGIGVAGADNWTTAQMRVNQSNYIFNYAPDLLDMQFRLQHGRARPPGVIPFDFLGTSGLGSYGTTRDLYDSNRVTDFQTVIQNTGSTGSFYTVRDQLIDTKK